MADHLTEEEQIETIKRWWSENWLSLVLPIVLVLAGYAGWNYWQQKTLESAQQASDKYQTLLGFFENPELTDSEHGQAVLLAKEIRDNYSGSLYADLSAMFTAKLAVDKGNLDEAEATLSTLVDNATGESVVKIAKARLAQVLLAKQEYARASALVAVAESDAVKALYAEIRGDIFLAEGKNAAAQTAYQEALASLLPEQRNRAAIIQFKMQGVSQQAVVATNDASQETQEQ